MWDHHDLFGDCLTMPLSWLLQLLRQHQPLKEIRFCFFCEAGKTKPFLTLH